MPPPLSDVVAGMAAGAEQGAGQQGGEAKLHVGGPYEGGMGLARVHRKALLWLQAMPYMACHHD